MIDYQDWEAERKALWEKYVSHYTQASDGIHSANIFVFEHCVLERRLCDKGLGLEGLTDDQKDQIHDIDSHAASIIDSLYLEASIPLDARKGEVICKRCGLNKNGWKVFISTPVLGLRLHDEFCHTCK